jgi:NAD(P)-dependent dehydrogenase (short-subunit alcohol dehydrogenase family)
MLLRQGLLEGKSVAVSGSVDTAVRDALVSLGAAVAPPETDEEVDALVHDAGAALQAYDLAAALEQAWSAIAEVAARRLIPAGRPGKVIVIAPRPDAGMYAAAARDALENLARTLSVEWARYAITTVAITPGPRTNDEQLATVVCFLLSRAGDYFSGCRLELGTVD